MFVIFSPANAAAITVTVEPMSATAAVGGQ
jgi:hypothetical protein